MVRTLVLVFAMAALCGPASARSKVALILTNQSYAANPGALLNPHRDGERVAHALEAVGFEVIHRRDLAKDAVVAAVTEYAKRLSGAGPDAVGFFYYSGHGAANSVSGDNFLIPVGAPVTSDTELPLRAVKLAEIIETIKTTGAKVNFIVFDACRDPIMTFSVRSGNKGLRREEKRQGTLIAFATEPGATATDEGVYAKALADQLVKPGQEATQVFRAVRRAVQEATARSNPPQRPHHIDELDEDFVFNSTGATPAKEVAAATPPSTPPKDVGGKVEPRYFKPSEDRPADDGRQVATADPTPIQPAPQYFFVWDTRLPDNWLDLRTAPNGGALIEQMPNGTPLEVLGSGPGTWLKVRQVNSGAVGWAAWGNGGSRTWIYCCRTTEMIPSRPRPYGR